MRTTTIIAALVLASVGADARADYYSDYSPSQPPARPERPICRKVEGGVICDVERVAPIEFQLGCKPLQRGGTVRVCNEQERREGGPVAVPK